MENKFVTTLPSGPKSSRSEPVAPISKARAAVLARLRDMDGTLSVEQLAAQTGQHANTAREHLEALVSDGYATKTAAPSEGRGRPAWLYEAVATPAGPVGYAALAAALVSHLAANSANPAAEGEAAGRAWARALPGGDTAAGSAPDEAPDNSPRSAPAKALDKAADKDSTKASDKAARGRVLTALGQAGFGVQGNRDTTELALTTCPIVEAARENPDVVCAVHLGLVKELLSGSGLPEREVVLLPFAGPGLCTLHLPSSTQHSTQASAQNSASETTTV